MAAQEVLQDLEEIDLENAPQWLSARKNVCEQEKSKSAVL